MQTNPRLASLSPCLLSYADSQALCVSNLIRAVINANTDGSTPEKYGTFTAVSPFWPPCLTGTPILHLTQKGVGPPNKGAVKLDTIGGSPPAVEMAR